MNKTCRVEKGNIRKEKNNRNKNLTERVDSTEYRQTEKLVVRGQSEKVKLEEQLLTQL